MPSQQVMAERIRVLAGACEARILGAPDLRCTTAPDQCVKCESASLGAFFHYQWSTNKIVG